MLFTLDVDGKRFAIGQAGDGGATYDWLSEPNKGYGFASSGTPNRSVEERRQLADVGHEVPTARLPAC